MLATSLLAERQRYLDEHAELVDDDGKRLVVANGYAEQREVVTGAGPVTVDAPRVNDKRDGEKFSSNILPAYMRRSPKVTEVPPILYLRGLSTGDFAPALSDSWVLIRACRRQRSVACVKRGKTNTPAGNNGT